MNGKLVLLVLFKNEMFLIERSHSDLGDFVVPFLTLDYEECFFQLLVGLQFGLQFGTYFGQFFPCGRKLSVRNYKVPGSS